MMLIRFYICIIYLLLFTCMMQANLRFTPFPNRQLPSNEVRKLYQDSEGYIWIPTYNGLARYDGHNVVNYGFNNDHKQIIQFIFKQWWKMMKKDFGLQQRMGCSN